MSNPALCSWLNRKVYIEFWFSLKFWVAISTDKLFIIWNGKFRNFLKCISIVVGQKPRDKTGQEFFFGVLGISHFKLFYCGKIMEGSKSKGGGGVVSTPSDQWPQHLPIHSQLLSIWYLSSSSWDFIFFICSMLKKHWNNRSHMIWAQYILLSQLWWQAWSGK